jgi:hypothetical protein
MPLPKSVLCTNCKKTYPEGWKRCPYCGHSESAQKAEAQSRRFMQQKLREWEQRTGRPREEHSGERGRPHDRGERHPQRQQQGRVRGRDQRQPQSPRPPQPNQPRKEQQRQQTAQQPQQQPIAEGPRTGRRRRRRRGGDRSAPGAAQAGTPQPQQTRPTTNDRQQGMSRDQNPPRSAPGTETTPVAREGGDGERSKRRRRFRRRRPGGGGREGGPPTPAPSGD